MAARKARRHDQETSSPAGQSHELILLARLVPFALSLDAHGFFVP
jgi:hypothetical protein